MALTAPRPGGRAPSTWRAVKSSARFNHRNFRRDTMKKMILLALVLSLSYLKKARADVPAYMQDGEITVTLRNGQTYKFRTNEWKIVNRAAKAAPEPKPAAEETA